MAAIFYFSSRPDPLGFVGPPEPRSTLGRLAHVLEYAGLALLLHRALAGGRDGEDGRDSRGATEGFLDLRGALRGPGASSLRCLVACLALSLAYAASDELHQAWVPGREGTLYDVGLDFAGAAAALALAWVRHAHHGVAKAERE